MKKYFINNVEVCCLEKRSLIVWLHPAPCDTYLTLFFNQWVIGFMVSQITSFLTAPSLTLCLKYKESKKLGEALKKTFTAGKTSFL